MGWKVVLYREVTSTNDVARHFGETGKEEIAIVADSQSKGRGRHGRSWASPGNLNLYISFVIRERIKVSLSGVLTLVSSVSVHDLLKSYGINPWIKWPNDVYVGERKIAGILNEVHPDPKGYTRFIILGIGLNVNATFRRTELEGTATSMKEELGRDVDRMSVLMKLLEEMDKNLKLYRESGPEHIIKMWTERAKGKITLEIDEKGSLTLKGKPGSGEGDLFLCS